MSSMYSNPVNHTSPIVAGIVAIFALSIAGIIFRILFIRRMRAAAYANQAFRTPLPMRQTFPVPRPPPPPLFNPPPSTNNFNPPPNWNRTNNHNNWSQPPPPYPQPASPPPRSPPPPSSPPTSPRRNARRSNPPTPATPTQPSNPRTPPPSNLNPQSAPSPPSPPSAPSPPSPPSAPSPPSPPSAPSQPTRPNSASMNLVDRMREVQSLMLQIHNLESQPTSQTNREKIQDLQRRVTELSDVETDHEPRENGPGAAQPAPATVTANAEGNNTVHEDGRSVANDGAARREPPPYALDGRDD